MTTITAATPLFRSRQHFTTMGAEDVIAQHQIDPNVLLARHFAGDHGEIDGDDLEENKRSGYAGGQVLSEYRYGADRLWVITDVGHETTTILTPDEY